MFDKTGPNILSLSLELYFFRQSFEKERDSLIGGCSQVLHDLISPKHPQIAMETTDRDTTVLLKNTCTSRVLVQVDAGRCMHLGSMQ